MPTNVGCLRVDGPLKCRREDWVSAIANHESPNTTKLYDRTGDHIDFDEIEQIRI
jgi:hypothetical protein